MTLPNGAYSVTASKSGFTSKTVTGVVVSSGTTTTRNIALSPSTTTGALSGTVRASGTGFPITGATGRRHGGLDDLLGDDQQQRGVQHEPAGRRLQRHSERDGIFPQ